MDMSPALDFRSVCIETGGAQSQCRCTPARSSFASCTQPLCAAAPRALPMISSHALLPTRPIAEPDRRCPTTTTRTGTSVASRQLLVWSLKDCAPDCAPFIDSSSFNAPSLDIPADVHRVHGAVRAVAGVDAQGAVQWQELLVDVSVGQPAALVAVDVLRLVVHLATGFVIVWSLVVPDI